MILCDSSVWIALAIDKHLHNAAARAWLETIDDLGAALFCRATQQSLLRLLTTASVFAPYNSAPLNGRQAWTVYDTFIADERIAYQSREPASLESHWRRFTTRDTASPKLWMDAYLAAFAVASGYRMVTTDTAFTQFSGLDLVLIG